VPGQWWPEARTRGVPMWLRNHPLMQYHHIPSWPPVWTWIGGAENKKPRGEVGILDEVVLSNIRPLDRCFLYIEHEGSTYLGCLLIDDEVFCSQVANLLKGYYNHPIAEIGSINLAHTL
jgi:hypothetical protein